MSPLATIAPAPSVEERSLEILRDLLARALADYWSGVPADDELGGEVGSAQE
jgi:hypothetical protein